MIKEIRRSQQERDSQTDLKDTKLVNRASMLSTCQNYSIVVALAFLFIVAMIVSAFAVDMLIYDEGNVYSCPVDYMQETLAR